MSSNSPEMLSAITTTNIKTLSLQRYENFSDYEDDPTMAYGCNEGSYNRAGIVDLDNLLVGFGTPYRNWVKAWGMVYNPNDSHAYLVNRDNGQVQKFNVNNTSEYTTIFSDMQYFTLTSDYSKTYMFGSRKTTDNHNEIFRMDMDTTNMITVRVESVIGTNIEVNGFTSNPDDERIYFSDRSQNVYSLSWSLDDVQNMPIKLRGNAYNDIRRSLYYCQGFIYFANRNPETGFADKNIYAYDIENDGFRLLEGLNLEVNSKVDGTGGEQYFYVHPDKKSLIIGHTKGTEVLVGDNHDFYSEVITVGQQYFDGYDFSWPPVDGASSYQLDINGTTHTTTETSFTSRGHADGTVLKLKLSSSTDDVSYTKVKYAFRSAKVSAVFSVQVTSMPFANPNSATWADPYDNPGVAILCNVHTMYTVNTTTNEVTSVSSRNMQRLERCPTTGDIIAMRINSPNLYNAGKDAVHITNDTLPPPFYVHGKGIKFIHCSYDGKVYFVDSDNDVGCVELDGSGSQMVASTSNCKCVATDVYSPDKVVYNDGNTIKYLNLSTNITTDVLVESRDSYNDLSVIDDIVYFSMNLYKYGAIHLDGTEIKILTNPDYGYCFLVSPGLFTMFNTFKFDLHYDTAFNISALPAEPSFMAVSVSPVGIRATWSAIPDATTYKVGISTGADGENPITVHYTTSDTSALDYTHNLGSESTHTVYLMYDTLTETDLLSSSRTISIPAQSTNASDYSKEFFRGKNGKFDMTKVRNVDLGPVMNSLFESGDDVQVRLKRGKRFPKAKFVNQGDTVDVKEVEAVLLPFDETAGSSQSIGLRLSDGSTSSVLYDETADTIAIDSTVYSVGDYTVIDNMKVSVYAS